MAEGKRPRACEHRLEKEAAIREMRSSREFEELRDCSFAPTINRRIIQAKGPVVVRGLVRHLEVRQSANRKAEEKKMREDKAFYRNVSTAPVCYTVPEPFALTRRTRARGSSARGRRRRRRRCASAPSGPIRTRGGARRCWTSS